MGYYGFEYVSVAKKRAMAQKTIEKLRKKHADLAPVTIEGRALTKTWWGKAWNDNLESYSDYANRIGRGRSYVRNGAVLDLKIGAGRVTALVQGSRPQPYEVTIDIEPLAGSTWEGITRACRGRIESLQELIEGRFPKALAQLFTARGTGLFPAPREISLHCSCPDWAVMCKHVAAVLYGVGARLDENPALFFVLRDVNIDSLITQVVADTSAALLRKSAPPGARIIEGDLGALFGIDLDSGEDSAGMPEKPEAGKKPASRGRRKSNVTS